jgi:hypothetical protein
MLDAAHAAFDAVLQGGAEILVLVLVRVVLWIHCRLYLVLVPRR